ncbi:MAG TPA: hypothetical protein VFV38_07035 [Ktedonobacteraceae bacterium]|nr:hypothetical protein [Ktedonobacteraceae bacterium]
MPLFGRKAFPGIVSRQRLQLFFGQSLHRASMGGAMDPSIDALTPQAGLAVEIIEIAKRDPSPEALLGVAHGPLDLPLGLWSVRLTDTSRDPDGDHEVGKARVPTRLVLDHLQQHTFHAISQRHFR